MDKDDGKVYVHVGENNMTATWSVSEEVLVLLVRMSGLMRCEKWGAGQLCAVTKLSAPRYGLVDAASRWSNKNGVCEGHEDMDGQRKCGLDGEER